MTDPTKVLLEHIAASLCTPIVPPALFNELTAGQPRRDVIHRGTITVTLGDRELREGRDFAVDWATGVVTMHRSVAGLVTISAAAPPTGWADPRSTSRRRMAQWKRERRGGRTP